MIVVIAGASGFIGSQLGDALTKRGHTAICLSRSQHPQPDALRWDPRRGSLDAEELASRNVDAVVNLAGESLVERWSKGKKARIRDSRVNSTRLLAQTFAALPKKPAVFLSASAIGYYGDRGSAQLDEQSAAGDNFLSQVCVDWEQAAEPAAKAGIRTATLRFGIVLGTKGGAFPRMLAPFLMGAGGRLGTGRQYMSWIGQDDAIAAIEYLLGNNELSGPFNIVAPQPVTNLEFTQTLGGVLRKPTLVSIPAAMAHFAFGAEMADEVLLASSRVLPERLLSSGFHFKYAQLEPALRHLLRQPR